MVSTKAPSRSAKAVWAIEGCYDRNTKEPSGLSGLVAIQWGVLGIADPAKGFLDFLEDR